MRKLPNSKQPELCKAFAILDVLSNLRPQSNSLFADLMLARNRNETLNAYLRGVRSLVKLVLDELGFPMLAAGESQFRSFCSFKQLRVGMAKKT